MHDGHHNARCPAVFLDRDGTIIRECHHLTGIEQLELLPGAAAALWQMQAAGFRLVVVTNQSVIARGKLDEQGLQQIHDSLEGMLADEGVAIDGWYWCPHLPDGGCSCRKPSPALLLRARDELQLDLARSWMIGDQLSDTRAGKAAGGGGILVATGYGWEQVEVGTAGVDFDRFALDLNEAARFIHEHSRLTRLAM